MPIVGVQQLDAIAGVNTHGETHHAEVIDLFGRHLAVGVG